MSDRFESMIQFLLTALHEKKKKFLVSVEEVDISGYKNGLPKILAKGN